MEFLSSKDAKLVVVILEAIVLAGLFVGFYLIRFKKNRAVHEKNQTFWVLFNLVPILFVMAMSYPKMAAANFMMPTVMIHAISGTVCELLGIYLILRMKNKLPQNLRVKNFKRLMQITLTLWTLQALGGFFIYYSIYVATPK